MIKDAYVSYETAKLLKKKGFAEPLVNYYYTIKGERVSYLIPEEQYLCPTHQMTMAWLREKGIYITIIYGDYPVDKKVFWTPQIDSLEGFDLPDSFYKEYDLYEDAVEAAIKYCLENLIK